jgi:hypothetical protein
MDRAKKLLALTLMVLVATAVYALAHPAVKDAKSLAGKWTGTARPPSGKAFPVEVQIQPDGSYTSMIGATTGKGSIKIEGGKIMAEGHLSGPAGVAAGVSKSQLTVTSKGGKQVISGAGRNEAGPFDYELTKR